MGSRNNSFLNECIKVYEELDLKSKKSNKEILDYIKENELARKVCLLEDGELPENFQPFILNDLQKKYIEKKLEEDAYIEEDPESIIEEEVKFIIAQQNEEEIKKINVRRFEFFDKKIEDRIKLPLPKKFINKTYEKMLPDLSDDEYFYKNYCDKKIFKKISNEFKNEVYNKYELFMNEVFATILLPNTTYIMITMSKFKVNENEEGKKELSMTSENYKVSDYNYFKEFMGEYSGTIGASGIDESDSYFEKQGDTVLSGLYFYTEQFLEDTLLDIVKNENVSIENERYFIENYKNMFYSENFVDELVFMYLEILEDISMKDVFFLYEIKDQEENYDFALYDEDQTEKEIEIIKDFIGKLKKGSEKEINIFASDNNYYFKITERGEIINTNGKEVEESVVSLLWELSSTLMTSSIFLLKEKSVFKKNDQKEVFKVSGMYIKDGEFIPIDKESLSKMIIKVYDENEGAEFIVQNWTYGNVVIVNDEDE